VSALAKTSNKLAKVATNIIIDNHVLKAEDEVMVERRANLQQLKSIKGYLAGIKTAPKAQVYARARKTTTTQSVGLF
jgi:hypothetical protein